MLYIHVSAEYCERKAQLGPLVYNYFSEWMENENKLVWYIDILHCLLERSFYK